MHNLDRGQSAALRAKLLLGVAGAAAAASSAAYADQPTAPPADAQKWAPYSDFGGSVGSGMVGGKLDFFVPLFQNLDSLAYLNLGVGTETKANILYNVGFGYRTKVDSDWIVGLYAGHDGSQLEDNNTFGQGSFSAELMSADWDARINGYIAENAPKTVPGQAGLFINGTTIAILDAQDVGYSGFDGEVGYRVFSTDDTDVRVFIGGFHFSHSNSDLSSMGQNFNFGYRDISGPKARAEATVYDLDIIGNQSRLTVDGEIAHDDVRGTTGSFGVTLRIPLGNYSNGSSGAQALDELDRRMIDPVRHNDQVLTRSQFTKPEPVIIYGPHVTSQPTNTLLYVDNTLGIGTYANPTTFKDAASRPTTNAFIVLTSKQGPIIGGATLQPGQTVVAGGQTFTVEGEFSHTKVTHTFDPSTNVSVVPATAGGNVITVASNTSLYGFAITGDFGNAVYGKNVDHVNISHITIDGTGGGQNGINLQHTTSGEEIVGIDNVTISNLTGDGIWLQSDITDGGTSTQTFTLGNIAVSNVGGDGVHISDYAYHGSKVTTGITMSDVAVSGAGYNGISIGAFAYDNGTKISQTVTASNIAVSGAGNNGVDLSIYASTGASVTSTATLSNVAVSGAYYAGIGSYVGARGAGATVNQTLNLSNVAVSGGFSGVEIHAYASYGASVNQAATLSNITVSGAGGSNAVFGRGIDIYAGAYSAGAYVHQTATITNANVTYTTGQAFGTGIAISAFAGGGAAVVQSTSLVGVSSTHNDFGLYVSAGAYDDGHGPTTVDQSVTVSGTATSPANFSHNAYGGVAISAEASGRYPNYASQAAIAQSVAISNAVLDNNEIGLGAQESAGLGASVSQNISLTNVDVSHNSEYGVAVASDAGELGFASEHLSINGTASSYSNISYNGSDGLIIRTDAIAGGQVYQAVGVYYTHIDHNGGDGVHVLNEALGYFYAGHQYFYGHISQNLTLATGTISSNHLNGIEIENTIENGAQIDQLVYVYGETIQHNAGRGFYEHSYITTYNGSGFNRPTNLTSDVYIYNSNVSNNGGAGIEIDTRLYAPTYPATVPAQAALAYYSLVEQHINVGNTTVTGNAGSGFVAKAYESGVYGDNLQYITLANSTFTHNGGDGATFIANGYYGPGKFGAAIQEVTISGSTFNNNVRDGLYAFAQASGYQGRAEQHFTISNSTFDTNGRNGTTFNAYAHDGVYVTGYGCGQVQGVYGGCAIVRQTAYFEGSDISHNVGSGISSYVHAKNYGAVYNDSLRPAYTPTLFVVNSTVDGNGADGVHVKINAANNSYVYSYAIGVNSHFDHNVNDGVYVESTASSGSAIIQKTVLYSKNGTSYSSADHNGGHGIYAISTATGGAVNQTVGVYGTDVSYNGANGIDVRAAANPATGGTASGYVVNPNASVVAQYVRAIDSTIISNAGNGIAVYGRAAGTSAAISQYLGVVGSFVSDNTADGVHAFEIAYSGASVNQSLYFADDNIQNNLGNGVYAVALAASGSSAKQYVNFSYNATIQSQITGNANDGIYVGASAFTGGNVVQTAQIYDVNSSYNRVNGLGVSLGANGYGVGTRYLYYSHVSQNVIAAYDTFDHNGQNGIQIANSLYYGGAANQLLEFVGVDASHNVAGAGFAETTNMTTIRGGGSSLTTNITTDLYLENSTFNANGTNGIAITAHLNGPTYSPAHFYGYSYLIQHTTVAAVTADGNAGDGLLLDAQQSGRYGADLQYVTMSGSEFNHNTSNGARFLSTSYYGPKGFGATIETIGIDTSKFSYNGQNGLFFGAYASGNQGRAEQHVTITGSYVDGNSNNGVQINANARDGVYVAGLPCTVAQGLTGGCAFVRQNVYIAGTDISHNTETGISVTTYANNYGAIYGLSGRPHSPTLELKGDTITYNGNRGLNVSNHIKGNSYAYQYIQVIDTHIDHNNADGIYVASYVGGGSTLMQRTMLYSLHASASASYNGGNGEKIIGEALGGSHFNDLNQVGTGGPGALGVDLSHNGGFGFDAAVAYADGASTTLQKDQVYSSTINYNGDGVGLYSIGVGAVQNNYIGANEIGHNSFVGAYGEANFSAHQYVKIYSLGNDVHNNGTNYLFNAFGGAVQVLN